jgi:hypothetical protein
MQKTVLILRMLVSLFGIALIVLGALFWANRALTLIPLHMLLGVLFVLCLWGLVALGFYARVGIPMPLIVLIWSLIVPALGMEQVRLLGGPHRTLVQSLHLLVGLIAMGLGHGLARRISGARRAGVPGATVST